MRISGRDGASGVAVEVEFSDAIVAVSRASPDSELYIAPGWIDIQVNGFAGVDYNHAETPHQEIARSIRALFATGVTRFYATVITGSPEDMEGSLGNLSRAKDSLDEGDAIDGFHVEGPNISAEE